MKEERSEKVFRNPLLKQFVHFEKHHFYFLNQKCYTIGKGSSLFLKFIDFLFFGSVLLPRAKEKVFRMAADHGTGALSRSQRLHFVFIPSQSHRVSLVKKQLWTDFFRRENWFLQFEKKDEKNSDESNRLFPLKSFEG